LVYSNVLFKAIGKSKAESFHNGSAFSINKHNKQNKQRKERKLFG